MSEIAKAVKDTFGWPVLSGARIVDQKNGLVQVHIDHLIRDFPEDPEDRKSKVKAKKLISRQLVGINDTDGSVLMRGPCEIVDSQIIYQKASPSFVWSVTTLMKTGEAKPKPVIQVYKHEQFIGEFDMSNFHGAFCADPNFGWTGWDEEAGHFIYQAEMKEAEDKPKDYHWNPSWGETLPNVRKPAIFVISLGEAAKVVATLEPDEKCQPGQLIKTLAGKIHFVGIEVIPGRKYGVAYCPNRPTWLYSWDYLNDKKAKKCEIANPGKGFEAIHYPVYDKASNKISFFGTYLGGSHFHAHSLFSYDIGSKTVTLIVDGEADVISCNDGVRSIAGLFPTSPVPVTEIPSDRSIFVTSYNKAEIPLLRITPSGQISILDLPLKGESSCQIHQIHGDYILVSVSSRERPPRLFLGVSKSSRLNWYPVSSESEDKGVKQELYRISETVEVILSKPSNKESGPLIVFPHGGPNYAYSCEWSPFCAIAARLGYSVAAINYTGSAGYAQKNIRALEGRIGDLDVNDCLEAVGYLVDKRSYDPSRLFLFGGSHGGFLVAHLSARTEFQWRAVVAHNAVIDLPSMLVTSDIPEFAFGQLGLSYDLRHPRPPTSTELALMQAASPSSHVASVTAPTLVVIGEEDLRVPASQGKAWYGWLRGQGVEAEILCFPATGHAIDSPEGQYHEELAIFNWFANH